MPYGTHTSQMSISGLQLLCPAHNRRGIKRWCCLLSVWRLSVWRLSVAYIGPKSRTERPGKTKIGIEVAHITRDSDTAFKVKTFQGHQAALLTAVLVRQAAAAVGFGTCCPWETVATLPSARRRKALWSPWGGEVRGHTVAPTAFSFLVTWWPF